MLGLFGSLNLGARSLQTQQQGVEVAGQNIANVNNPTYARQRLAMETTPGIHTPIGVQGTGVESTAILQIRNQLVDRQIQTELSVRGYLEAYQQALQYSQSALGQQIDRMATGAEGAAASTGVGVQHGISDGLSDFFNALQSLSTQPSSAVERQMVLAKAAELAAKFNQTDQRLEAVQSGLNESIQADVTSANELLKEIARLNDRISTAEAITGGVANDLRDLRQQKLEQLSSYGTVELGVNVQNQLTVSLGGVVMVSGKDPIDSLQTFDAGDGRMLVRSASSGEPIHLSAGSIAGFIQVRDGEVASLRDQVNTLAAKLISEVNAVHQAGVGLNGTTGAAFFTGSDAASIRVNAELLADPSRLQAGSTGAPGDNSVVLEMAQLAGRRHPSLNGQTFGQFFGQTVAFVGQALAGVNTQLADQAVVDNMLKRQREAISGVSLDEEMADLVKFQRAYQASARFITTIDELLQSVINIKR